MIFWFFPNGSYLCLQRTICTSFFMPSCAVCTRWLFCSFWLSLNTAGESTLSCECCFIVFFWSIVWPAFCLPRKMQLFLLHEDSLSTWTYYMNSFWILSVLGSFKVCAFYHFYQWTIFPPFLNIFLLSMLSDWNNRGEFQFECEYYTIWIIKAEFFF